MNAGVAACLALLVLTSTPALAQSTPADLAAALDAPAWVWSTLSDSRWFGQNAVSHDGADAAQCGPVGNYTTSSLRSTVIGPGAVSFWWRVSTNTSGNLDLFLDGNYLVRGNRYETNWIHHTAYLPSGTNSLSWRFYSEYSSTGQSSAWLDQVEWTPGPTLPSFTTSPTNQTVWLGDEVRLNSLASGTPPFAYQWQFNGSPILGATNATLVLTNIQPAQAGRYRAIAANAWGSKASEDATLQVINLADFLDTPAWVWSTLSDSRWFGQNAVSHDGADAAQCGPVGNYTTSSLRSTVIGPGAVSFWWRVSTNTSGNLDLFLDGNYLVRGNRYETNWIHHTAYLPSGTNSLSWRFYSEYSSTGQSSAWLDQVEWTPGPTLPSFTTSPTNQTVWLGDEVRLNSLASGTPPFAYQWQFNGSPILGATNATLVLTNIQPAQAGRYRAIAANAWGSKASEDATLQVINLADFLDTPAWVWSTLSDSRWFGQNAVSHDGADAAQCGPVGNYTTSSLRSTVIGPGAVSFWWRVSTNTSGNLDLFLDGNYLVRGNRYETNWIHHTAYLPSGTNSLSWRFYSEYSSTGQSSAWLDQVEWTPGPTLPSFTTSPTNQTVWLGDEVRLNSLASGTPPFAYQWQFNGSPILGATNATLVLTNIQPAQAGRYRAIAANAWGSKASEDATLQVINLADFLDTPAWVWSTLSDSRWFGQNAVSHDGADAAQCGPVGNYTTSSLRSTVIGPGAVSFWWRVSTNTSGNLDLFLDGNYLVRGNRYETNWIHHTAYLPSGTNSLSWRFYSEYSSTGQSSAWLDQVEWTPGPTLPSFTTSPTNQTVWLGDEVRLNSLASGTPPFAYQWQFNGSPILGATNATLVLTNIQPAQAGRYRAIAANAWGSKASEDATLQVINLADFLDTPGWVWKTDGASRWFGQRQVSHDGVDAAQVSNQAEGSRSRLWIDLVGPGTLSFWWKTGGPPGYDDYLQLRTNNFDSLIPVVRGTNDWRREGIVLPPGTNRVEWSYWRTYGNTNRLTSAWVDRVEFVPGENPPLITTHPSDLTTLTNQTASLSVVAVGLAPLSYQWLFNEQPIPDGTNATLQLKIDSPSRAGNYRVAVTNPKGTTISSSARVSVLAQGTLTLVLAYDTVREDAPAESTTGTVSMDVLLESDLAVSLRVADTTVATTASTVTIPKGSRSSVFEIRVVNDGEMDGTQATTINVSAPGFTSASASLTVLDDDTVARRTLGGQLSGVIAADSYLVTSPILVNTNRVLTLLPGTDLRFRTNTGLTVSGVVQASGTPEAPIRLRSAAGVPSPGNWNGVSIPSNETRSNILHYVVISHAEYGLRLTGSGLRASIRHSTIENNRQTGIDIDSSNYIGSDAVIIESCSVVNNGGHGVGIYGSAYGCSDYDSGATLRDCEIASNQASGVALYADGSSTHGCTFSQTGTATALLERCHIHNNATGISASGYTGFHSGGNSYPTVRDCLIESNGVGVSLVRRVYGALIGNTIADNADSGVYFEFTGDPTFPLHNNILSGNGAAFRSFATLTNAPALTNATYNLLHHNATNWVNYPAGFGTVTTANFAGTPADALGNLYANPRFISPTDYHLRWDSPAVDAGLTNNASSTDYDHDTRDPRPDIGCDELSPNASREAYDIVWLDDGFPESKPFESQGTGPWEFVNSPSPASGRTALSSDFATGLHQVYGSLGALATPVGETDQLFASVYLDPVHPPRAVILQWHDALTGWNHRAYWGETPDWLRRLDGSPSARYLGGLPPAGRWVRLRVPAAAVDLSHRTVDGLALSLTDGQALWDYVGVGPARPFLWVDDDFPAGSSFHTQATAPWEFVADPTPASGLTCLRSDRSATFHQAYGDLGTLAATVSDSDELVASVYLDPADPPRSIMLQWYDSLDGWPHRAIWGDDFDWTAGIVGTTAARRMGPLPPAGRWVRLRVPAAEVALGGRTVQGVALTLSGGRASWDAIGVAPAAQTFWIDDTYPKNAVIEHFPTADPWQFTAQPAPVLGQNSLRSDINAGTHQAYGDLGTSATTVLPSDFLVASVYLDPVNPPRMVMLQWHDSLGGWSHRAYWGESPNWVAPPSGTAAAWSMGPLPPVGRWVRLSVPAAAVDLANRTIDGFALTLTGGQASWDAVGLAPGRAEFWIDDALPDAASVKTQGAGPWRFVDYPAPVSGPAALLSDQATGLHQVYGSLGPATRRLLSDDSLVASVYLDPIHPPRMVMLQWYDSVDGWSHRAYWGDAPEWATPLLGTPAARRIGPLPPVGRWVNLAVPVETVALAERLVQGFALSLTDGQALFDAVGVVSSPAIEP